MAGRLDPRFSDKSIARKIAEANGISVARLGLRFDRVVVRLLADLRESLRTDIPDGTTVLLTLTAPIKLPAKTSKQLTRRIRDLLDAESTPQGKRITVFQNEVRIRVLQVPTRQKERLLGFVHNPVVDSRRLLEMTVNWLAAN